jgi:ferredoxin--NADP+ reductase
MPMQILQKDQLAPNIQRFVIEAPLIAKKAKPGHFVVVRYTEKGERIPLTIADSNAEKGTITLICQGVGKSTLAINSMKTGDQFLDIMGPLGAVCPIRQGGTVVCVAGGLGAAPLYPKAKALREAGCRVITVMGAQREEMLILRDEFKAISDELYFSTDDGSFGHKGFVTGPLREILEKEKVDEVIAIGPVPMMANSVKVAKEFSVPTLVSLNAVMVDGTGMCGGCRVTIGGQTKFCCVDGPTFAGEEVDFSELMKRLSYYRQEEQEAMHRCRLEGVNA